MTDNAFTRLAKNCKREPDDSFLQCKLALLGDCATQHLATALKGYAFENNIALNLFDADYNQIYAQVMDSQSEMYAFSPDIVLIYMCSEKLYETYCNLPTENRATFAEEIQAQIQSNWNLINQNTKARILQFNFVECDDSVFGNYANKVETSFVYQLKKLNFLFIQSCILNKNVYPLDLNQVQCREGRNKVHDDKLYYIAKLPLATCVLPMVSRQVVDVIETLYGKAKKCVVMDLDNTLWGGVIGDDGLEGIQIGELGIGHAFSDLQMWLRELGKRGILLAVCSKNDENIAKEPFLKHPEMVLRLENISIFVANWEDKASNLKYIQKTLNIGMDSIVFLDDNPFERNLIKSMIPEVEVPELPDDPALYLNYIKSLNLFETASYSQADSLRTKQYQEEIGRSKLQQQFSTFEEYLFSLEMVAEVRPFDEFNYSRIAQLTQRSNQFNLRTVRYTEAEIEALANDPKYINLYFTLKDKFGDHGLVSVVVLEKNDSETLFINTWLMSCRVLKRGMEEFIINKIMEKAMAENFSTVLGEYIQTTKNGMVQQIYEKLGFEAISNTEFVAKPASMVKNKTFIEEICDNDQN